MKVGLRVAAAIALATLFIFSAIYFRRPPDPIFEGRLASEWALDLLSPDYTVRGEAQTALKAFGEPAVPQLCLLLKKRNASWQDQLVRLNSIFPSLQYRRLDAVACRERAAEMLGLLGSRAQSAIPHLVQVLGLDQTSPEIERALVRIGPAAIVALRVALTRRNSFDDAVRVRAARVLREFGPLDRTAIAVLIGAASDHHPLVRKEAALSLGVTARHEPAAMAALLPLAQAPEPEVRAAALAALGGIGLSEPSVITALRAGLRDNHSGVKLEAAQALWTLGQDPGTIVPALLELLAGHEQRWRATYLLGDMGPSAAAAVPALVKVLLEEQVPRPFRTPPSSAFALGKIGEAAIPRLSTLLAHRDARVRMSAVLALGFMEKNGRAAAPDLIHLLNDRHSEVRHAAALSLAAISDPSEQIIAGLNACLGAEDVYMRSAAAAFLRHLAPEGDWVVQPE